MQGCNQMKTGRPGRCCNRTLADLVLPETGDFLCEWNVRSEVMLVKSGCILRSLVDHYQSSHYVSPISKFSRRILLRRLLAVDLFGTPVRNSRQRMPILGRITSGRMMPELPLDVAQQSAGSEAKHFCPQPRWAEFFLDHGQPVDRLLRRADSTCWFETHRHTRLLRVFADGARH